jgi:hypothetical protein
LLYTIKTQQVFGSTGLQADSKLAQNHLNILVHTTHAFAKQLNAFAVLPTLQIVKSPKNMTFKGPEALKVKPGQRRVSGAC